MAENYLGNPFRNKPTITNYLRNTKQSIMFPSEFYILHLMTDTQRRQIQTVTLPRTTILHNRNDNISRNKYN